MTSAGRLLMAALALSGVAPAEAAVLRQTAAQPPAEADAEQPRWVISPDGVRGVRIGMTEAEALAALNRDIDADAFARWITFGDNLDDPQSCRGLGMRSDGEGEYGALTFMVEGGRVTRYSILAQDPAAGAYVTDRGVTATAAEANIRRAYPDATATAADYAGRPMRVFTTWTTPGERGLAFVVEEGRLWEIHAGGPSIQRIQGCP